MKIIYVLAVWLCSIIYSNSRLLEKVTERNLINKTKNSSSKVRLARNIEDIDTFAVNSREYNEQEDEYIRYYRQVEYVKKSIPIKPEYLRQPRALKNVTSTTGRTSVTQFKPIITPVKKPIPKYNEMDYDDDFQMKINTAPINPIDSSEHEDEDFNLNDYDFDINHDEFVGRGKPLEPRLKQKDIQDINETMKRKEKHMILPVIKVKAKTNMSPSNRATSNKKERSIETPKKIEKEDYYDDTTSTKVPTTKEQQELEDELIDDNEESKDYEGKSPVIRQIRSPWKIDTFAEKFGEKTSFKILSILPMFPEVPGKNKYFEYTLAHAHRKPAWNKKNLKSRI